MIQIPRTRTAKELGGFTGAALQKKLLKLLQYYYDDGANGKLNFKLGPRKIWGKAKPQLKVESFNKCAYCEANTAVVAHGDVEHFRPKSAYWWLAYCYDNYTFSCQVCNQVHKNDNFTVQGSRLAAPRLPRTRPTDAAALATLASRLCPDPGVASAAAVKRLFSTEDADLVDPYTSDPEKLFAWEANADTEEVRLVPRGNSTRAKRAVKAAEEILGLNRTELLKLRWIDYDQLEVMALALQEGRLSEARKKRVLEGLLRQAGSDRPFAGMKRYFLRTWGLLS